MPYLNTGKIFDRAVILIKCHDKPISTAALKLKQSSCFWPAFVDTRDHQSDLTPGQILTEQILFEPDPTLQTKNLNTSYTRAHTHTLIHTPTFLSLFSRHPHQCITLVDRFHCRNYIRPKIHPICTSVC